MRWWFWPLWPFALLYDLITRIRNFFFDSGWTQSFQFETNVISVGNLSLGGTGKTPMVEYLIRYLHEENHVTATLSRGYGRKTHGMRIASGHDTADTLGDESFMYHRKFGSAVTVAVGVERILAIPEILLHRADTSAIVLDDAFQHRSVNSSLSLLTTTYQRPFYKDFVIPMGRLREARSGARRADIILVSKCPVLSEADQVRIKQEISVYSKAPVFFTTIQYDEPLPLFDTQSPLQKQIVGISGIADSQLFDNYLDQTFSVKLKYSYGDHHRYTKQDVKDIINELDEHTSMLCTEKDAVKLGAFDILKNYSVYYLPIKVQFLKDESLFKSMVSKSLKSYQIE